MGGSGSGAYGPIGPLNRKRTVEETPSIGIKDLKDYLGHKRLSFSWNSGEQEQSVGVIHEGDYLLFVYQANGERIREWIKLEETPVGYGKRLWFCCPDCDKRRGKLYIVGKYFRCYKCHNLNYLTSQESGDPLDYLYLKISRLQKQLGLEKAQVDDVPFKKPKHMHWKTYKQLRIQLIDLQIERNEEFMRQVKLRWG